MMSSQPNDTSKGSSSKLLPQSMHDFSTSAFWDNFFEERKKKSVDSSPNGVDSVEGNSSFEWYGEWCDIAHLVLPLLAEQTTTTSVLASTNQKISFQSSPPHLLVVGCGNSTLSADVYRAGCKSQVNLDFSPVVIEEMQEKYPESKWPGMTFQLGDMTDMVKDFENDSTTFSHILDKGALDALYAENTPTHRAQAQKMLNEIQTLLEKNGKSHGSYVCVSLGEHFILKTFLEFWKNVEAWTVDIHSFIPRQESGSGLPPLLLIASKAHGHSPDGFIRLHNLRGATDIKSVFDETKGDSSSQQERNSVVKTNSIDKAMDCIDQFRFCAHEATRLCQPIPTHQRLQLDLWTDTASGRFPKYRVSVLDFPQFANDQSKPCCAVVIPPGRELEWLFRSLRGQRQLGEQCGYARLLLFSIVPGFSVGNENETGDSSSDLARSANAAAAVKAELEPHIVDLRPKSMRANLGGTLQDIPIPIMTIGDTEGSLGSSRQVIYKGDTELSGPYVIEDVCIGSGADMEVRRRLIFMRNQNAVQSECRLVPKSWDRDQEKEDRIKRNIDDDFLGAASSSTTKKRKGKKSKKKNKTRKKKMQHKQKQKNEFDDNDNQNDNDTNNEWIVDSGLLAFPFHRGLVAGALTFAGPLLDRSVNNSTTLDKDASSLLRANGLGTSQTTTGQDPETKEKLNIAVIGIGGGGLPRFLHDNFQQVISKISCVEIDSEMIDIARKHFGFPGADTLPVDIEDGVKWVHKMKEKIAEGENSYFDAVIVDVNASDLSTEITFPATPFLAESFFESLHAILSPSGGLFAMNVSCRDPQVYQGKVINVVKKVFCCDSSASTPGRKGVICDVFDPESGDLNRCLFGIRYDYDETRVDDAAAGRWGHAKKEYYFKKVLEINKTAWDTELFTDILKTENIRFHL
eukprot:g2842.t1